MVTARLTIDPHFTVGLIDRRLFGAFVEHLGRCVYDGLYEPDHPSADSEGFREDARGLDNRSAMVTSLRILDITPTVEI